METQSKPIVLVVDDDATFQEVLQHWGSVCHVKIVSALTTDEGLRRFEEERPRVIAMDGQISGNIDSLELVHTMRERGFQDHIIAISSYEEVRKSFVAEGPERGCDMECEKSELPKTLAEVLDLYL